MGFCLIRSNENSPLTESLFDFEYDTHFEFLQYTVKFTLPIYFDSLCVLDG